MSDVTRVERLLNLLACLLDTAVPIPQEVIVREVAGYPEGRAACRRAFERDKEALRGMGVPLVVEPVPFGDGNEVGYRVPPDEYYLPDLGLSDEETAALNVAVNAVHLGSAAAHGALLKLGGGPGSAGPPVASLPLAPALVGLFEGFRRRAVVRFGYRGRTRTVEPWGLSARQGRWYLVGHDRDRDTLRTFRADRVEGDVEVGPGGEFEVPSGFRPAEHIRAEPWTWGEGEPVAVRFAVDDDHTEGVTTAMPDATVVERRDGATVFEASVVDRAAFRTFLLGFLEHAEVEAPPEVRDEVVAWLRRLAGDGSAAA